MDLPILCDTLLIAALLVYGIVMLSAENRGRIGGWYLIAVGLYEIALSFILFSKPINVRPLSLQTLSMTWFKQPNTIALILGILLLIIGAMSLSGASKKRNTRK